MTGIAPDRPLSAGLQGGRGRSSFPERPVLTVPPNLQPPQVADARRQRLAAQPWLGVGGLLLTAVVFFALALGTGSTATGLLILGPISTFALAGVAMIAFWWNDWPGSRLSTPWTGVIDTVLVAAIAVVLTIAGQAVIERPDIGAVFEATPGPAAPTTFPATMALAGATFAAMLQLSLVCERWPLGGFGRLRSGIAALIAVGVWQAVLFIALRGWPVNTITRRSMRLLAGNA